MNRSTVGVILGLLFWIPLFGTLCSALAIAFGFDSLKQDKSTALASAIIGIAGLILAPILFIYLSLSSNPILEFLLNLGTFDVAIPFTLIFIFLSLLIFVILKLTKITDFTKSIISIIASFVIVCIPAAMHILGIYGFPEIDLFTIINQALPLFAFIFILAIIVYLGYGLLEKEAYWASAGFFILSFLGVRGTIGAALLYILLGLMFYGFLRTFKADIERLDKKAIMWTSIIGIVVLLSSLILTFFNMYFYELKWFACIAVVQGLIGYILVLLRNAKN